MRGCRDAVGHNEKIALHRHKADDSTLVVQGELRIYRPNGELKEVRPVGSYVTRKLNGEPHSGGGGDCDVNALFSNRNVDGLVKSLMMASTRWRSLEWPTSRRSSTCRTRTDRLFLLVPGSIRQAGLACLDAARARVEASLRMPPAGRHASVERLVERR
jgi:hypothetical protein